jgi:uncharacterized protein
MADPIKIIQQYYDADSKVYDTLIAHGEAVSKKALRIAERLRHLKPNMTFIQEAAMLHDIGIFMTHVPELGLRGQHPYICHGVLGRKLLEKQGLHQHARVCENHVGVGISRHDVKRYRLPLPEKDMLPETLEEEIICYADKFFSKNPNGQSAEIPVERIIKGLKPYGRDKVSRFLTWKERFE